MEEDITQKLIHASAQIQLHTILEASVFRVFYQSFSMKIPGNVKNAQKEKNIIQSLKSVKVVRKILF